MAAVSVPAIRSHIASSSPLALCRGVRSVRSRTCPPPPGHSYHVMDEGVFGYPGGGSSLRLVWIRVGLLGFCPSRVMHLLCIFVRKKNVPSKIRKVVFLQGFHGANARQCHPYTMTAQARTKRGLWGYLLTGRKIVILSFSVLEIRGLYYPGLRTSIQRMGAYIRDYSTAASFALPRACFQYTCIWRDINLFTYLVLLSIFFMWAYRTGPKLRTVTWGPIFLGLRHCGELCPAAGLYITHILVLIIQIALCPGPH